MDYPGLVLPSGPPWYATWDLALLIAVLSLIVVLALGLGLRRPVLAWSAALAAGPVLVVAALVVLLSGAPWSSPNLYLSSSSLFALVLATFLGGALAVAGAVGLTKALRDARRGRATHWLGTDSTQD